MKTHSAIKFMQPTQRLQDKTQRRINELANTDILEQQEDQGQSREVYQRKDALKQIKVPQNLQPLAQRFIKPIERKKIQPKTLQTTRLKPTEQLQYEYRTGAVEGVENKWRDVSLKGIKPGPLVRPHPEVYKLEQKQKQNERDAAERAAFSPEREHLEEERKIQLRDPAQAKITAQSLSEKIGRLMRNQLTHEQIDFTLDANDYQGIMTMGASMTSRNQTTSELLDEVSRIIYRLQQDTLARDQDLSSIAKAAAIANNVQINTETTDSSKMYEGMQLSEQEHEDLKARLNEIREILLADNNDGLLPLEIFDAEAFYETHSPEEWLKNHSRTFKYPDGSEVIGVPAFSRYLFDKRLSLQPCVVKSYNPEKCTFEIKWITNNVEQSNFQDVTCERKLCALSIGLNDFNQKEKGNYVYKDSIVPSSVSVKQVKRLNLLFAHESEALWFRRREAARETRRRLERQMNMKQFITQSVKMAAKLREYIANRDIQLGFRITRLLEFLSDVAGVTSEIVDNIFNERVLYNHSFKSGFLDKLDEDQFQKVLKRAGEMIQDVSANFVCANMVCTLDYLRRSQNFEKCLRPLNISRPSFVIQFEKTQKRLDRYIGTMSGDFEPNPVKALNSYDLRMNRINTIFFAGNTQYNTAYLLMKQVLQDLYTMRGLYIFNFAAIAPYLAPDQIALVVKDQFNGGAARDKEAYQINIGGGPTASQGPEDTITGSVAQTNVQVTSGTTQPAGGFGLTCIPYYAHPNNKNLELYGYVSPALPLPIKQFQAISENHRERLLEYFNDLIGDNLAHQVSMKLTDAKIDVNSPYQQYDDGVARLNSHEDYYDAINQGGTLPSVLSPANGGANNLNRPRPRSLYDLERFCKLWNMRYYDIVMEIVENTLNKLYNMYLEFRWTNRYSYKQVCESVNDLILKSKNSKINSFDLAELIQQARRPLFYTTTETTVSTSLIQVFVSLDAYLRNIRQQNNGEQSFYFVTEPCQNPDLEFREGYIPECEFGEWDDKNYYLDVLTHPKYVEANNIVLPKGLSVTGTVAVEQSATTVAQSQLQMDDLKGQVQAGPETFQSYLDQLSIQAKICTEPTVVQLQPKFIPSLQETRQVFQETQDTILDFVSQLQTIENRMGCKDHEDSFLYKLPASSEVHDPWIPEYQEKMEKYLYEAEQGPICVLQMIEYLIRQLYYVNPVDHTMNGEVQALPYVDDFVTLNKVSEDINNEEDYNLIEYADWNYDFVKKEEKQEAVTQQSKEEDADAPEEESEKDTDDEKEEAENTKPSPNARLSKSPESQIKKVKVNNSCFSLRDLRTHLIRLTIIKDIIKQLPNTINFGLYVVNVKNCTDILFKKVQVQRAIVCRILQKRTVKLSESLMRDWDEINYKLHMDIQTARQYHEAKEFLKGFPQMRERMHKQMRILERYYSVMQEFQFNYQDMFLKHLYQQEASLITLSYVGQELGKQNAVTMFYQPHLTDSFGKEKEKDNDLEYTQAFYNVKVQEKFLLMDQESRIRILESSRGVILDKKITKARDDINKLIDQYIKDANNFMQNADRAKRLEFYIKELHNIVQHRVQIQTMIQDFSQDETYLGVELTTFENFDKTVNDFQIFEELWTIFEQHYQKYAGWTESYFGNVDGKEVGTMIGEWTSGLNRLVKTLQKTKSSIGDAEPEQPGKKEKSYAQCCYQAANQAQDLIESINKFNDVLPLVTALRNPGLTEAHWREISKYTKTYKEREGYVIDTSSQQSFTLNMLLAEGLNSEEQLVQVQRISSEATRESAIKKQYEKMVQEANKASIEFRLYDTDKIPLPMLEGEKEARYKTQNYYIIKSFDEIFQLIDEQFSVIQGIRASPFYRKFKSQVDAHEQKLDLVQTILDNWIKFQRLWLYLQPIFKSEDIKKQLREKALEFAEVCQAWSQITCDAQKGSKNIMTQLFNQSYEAMNLAAAIQKRFIIMEGVNKELSAYLQAKRMSFSRFFFLADEELLQILAQTKNVEMVQDHIQKCFEGIKSLTFAPSKEESGLKDITQMVSPEGEVVPLQRSILAKGDVDLWLSELEIQMKTTMKHYMFECYKDYVNTVQNAESRPFEDYSTLMGPREIWLAKGPAQTVNILSQVAWTVETEVALREQSQAENLEEWNKRIDRLVVWVGVNEKIREENPQIQYNNGIRKMITTLLTLWVHNRDVIGRLMRKDVDPEFLFASQLKYYVDPNKKELLVRQVDAIMDYQYEYLGNHDRLVITSLTDRAFLTMITGLFNAFGIAPQGPAGTGKSETVKDLAKSLAIGCYIFNCSEGLNEQSIGKFFTGLCISGMYACLDEFNRCKLDVLSVVAQQILTIQRAIKANKTTFDFEGQTIKLQKCSGIFITMNPGYAGRAELPTNLKNLFRPIAMTVPDYTMIAEIFLFACGYRDASALAVKIVMTLKLSSEQLSKVSHYDFGMRALKSILYAASRLKRLQPETKEDILCLRALCDVNIAKFLSMDLPLFNNIVSDLFMECYTEFIEMNKINARDETEEIDLLSLNNDEFMQHFIIMSAKQLNYTPSSEFLLKTLQLYQTLTVRHGLMNVGLTMTGKSAAFNTLQNALGLIKNKLEENEALRKKYNKDGFPLFNAVQVFKLNAKSITADELYGNFSSDTNEWADGILCTIMRQCTLDHTKLKWILIDSPVDALWIENLNTILDDAKRLCLTSGEVIAMTEETAYMFEVRDLDVASPATVSRCGMIYYDASVIKEDALFQHLCIKLLPKWLLELSTDLQGCWPMVQYKIDDPANITSFDALTVCGKGAEGNLMSETYTGEAISGLDRLLMLFNWIYQPVYQYVINNNKPVIFQKSNTIIYNMVKVIAAYVNSFIEPDDVETITEQQADEITEKLPPIGERGSFIDSIFTFGMTWSIGAISDQKVRQDFTAAYKHYAYDLPLYLSYQAFGANADLNHAKFKFAPSTAKMTQQQIDQLKQRAQNFQDMYYKNIPANRFMFRMENQVPIADSAQQLIKKGKEAQILTYHDVCLQSTPVEKKDQGAKQNLTAMVVSQRKQVSWMQWENSIHAIKMDEFTDVNRFNDTIVPTADVVSLLTIIEYLSKQFYPILLAGPSGSGKTSLGSSIIEKLNYAAVKCVLTAQTSSTQIRSVVDTKLERKRKGIYALNKSKPGIFYVDDAHMPAKEEYGAQPPLEVLRQLFEDKGWYDITQGIFKKIVEMTTIVGCTTSGNLDLLPERLVHHLTLVSIPENTNEAFGQIFSVLLTPLAKACGNAVGSIIDNMVPATILLYRKLREQFKPTPAHMHYVFGPRDLSKIFQGLLLPLKNGQPKDPGFQTIYSNPATVAALWVSECQRVFGDRLINLEDRQQFVQTLNEAWSSTEGATTPIERLIPDHCFDKVNKVYDSSFSGIYNDAISKYQLINLDNETQSKEVEQLFQAQLSQHGKRVLGTDMRLILFRYALNHLVRISRILQSDRGHALLIGMPSSGKRSLTRLAFLSLQQYYMEMDQVNSVDDVPLSLNGNVAVFEPTSKSDFMDYIRKATIHCGRDGFSGLLIVQESLTDDYCLECLNFLISLGEIPNLFNLSNAQQAEEFKEILKVIGEDQLGKVNSKRKDKPQIDTGKQSCLEIMAQRVQRNLHIVIAVTPNSASLDRIVSQFPSLLGSLTINWFDPWELATLRSIAYYYLKEEKECERIVDTLVEIHLDTEKIVNQKYPNLCSSPATFLSLIQTFQELKKKQQRALLKKQDNYTEGVKKMKETDEKVKEIQVEQKELQPVLQTKSEQVRKLKAKIDESKKATEVLFQEMQIKEQKAMKEKTEADELAAQCQEDVAKAMPIKLRAERALGALKNEDVAVMKKMGNPAPAVKLVMEAVCVILGAKFKPGADNWAQIKLKFSDPKILYTLKEFKGITSQELADHLQKYYVSSEDFQAKKVEKSSVAAAGMCEWVHALYDYYVIMLDVQPKLDAEAAAKKKAADSAEQLAIQQAELKKVQDELHQMELDGQAKQDELNKLTDNYTKCCENLSRAEQLISGLAGESTRWQQSLQDVEKDLQNVVANSLLATAYCAQLGPIEFIDRQYLSEKWQALIIDKFHTEEQPIDEVIKNFKLEEFLYDIPTVLTWQSKGLGKDNFNITSACVSYQASKVPLIFDPQDQGRYFINNCLATAQRGDVQTSTKVVRYSDQALTKIIKECLVNSYSLVIEQISSDQFINNDPRIKAAIIAHNKLHVEGNKTARVTYSDGKDIDVNDSFRLTLVTTFDVSIPPDSFNDFRVVTFKSTREALQDLLINIASQVDDAEGEKLRMSLISKIAEMRTQLATNEMKLLEKLVVTVNPIEDSSLITMVNDLGQQSADMKRKMESDQQKQKESEAKRNQYKELALLCATLFFVLLRLVNLDSMYECSLQNFIKVFKRTVTEVQPEDPNEKLTSERRLNQIMTTFAERIYMNTSQGLFVSHKLSFSLDIALSLEQAKQNMSKQQFDMIMACCSRNLPHPSELEIGENQYADEKVNDQQWRNFFILCNSGLFVNLTPENIPALKKFINSEKIENIEPLNELEFMLFCILLKDDLISVSVQNYVKAAIGPQFINMEAPQLIDVCTNAVSTIPTLILLSADSDPSNSLVALAETSGLVPQNVQVKCRFVSLGRGQGPNAQKQIDEAVQHGGWVVLGNSHLAGSWLQTMESIIESIGMENYMIDDKVVPLHESFRIFLTTMPFDGFPSSIIRAATKVSAESPMGIKNNFIRMIQQLEENDLELVTDDEYDKLSAEQQQVAVQVQQSYRKYLWNLGIYFSTVLERRRFGPIGFSTGYDWADPDYVISKMQLHTQFGSLLGLGAAELEDKLQNTINSLRFLISDINVGGRVSDFKDSLIVQSLINAYYQEDLSKLGEYVNEKYQIPKQLLSSPSKDEFLTYIKQSIPDIDSPQLFGLDQISLLISSGQKGRGLLSTVLSAASGAGSSSEDGNLDQEIGQIDQIVANLPEVFNLGQVLEKYPTDYYQCMNTVLTQEAQRFNKLIQIITKTLKDCKQALQGLIIKTELTDTIRSCLKMNKVPKVWEKAAWPSLMGLSSWLEDLGQRSTFLHDWVETGKQEVVWFSGFFYPQAFITATLQNHARRTKTPVDQLVLDFKISTEMPEKGESDQIIRGLFLQNAALNSKDQLIDAKQQFEKMPYIKFIPMLKKDLEENEKTAQRYKCPVYRTTERKGVLTTTGHSSNYIFDILIECEGFEPLDTTGRVELVQKWIRRGTAMFQQQE